MQRTIRRSLVVLAAPLMAASSATAQAPQTGALIVSCNRPCAVSVDGEDAGHGPAVVRELLPGAHLVVVRGEDGTTAQRMVEVEAGRSIGAELELEAPAQSGATADTAQRNVGTAAADVPTEHAEPPAPTRQPMPAPRAPGSLTPEPEGWQGGMEGGDHLWVSYVLAVPAAVLGVVGVGMVIVETVNDRAGSGTFWGGLGLLGGGVALAGIASLFTPDMPSPEEAGSVYFAGAITPDGVMVGGRLRL